MHQVWLDMAELRNVQPYGIMPTSLRGLQIHVIRLPALLDLTDAVHLGGHASPHLLGPTPASLIPPGVPAQALPQDWFQQNGLPRHVRDTPAARNPANWAQ